jgi:hypothetical protein
MNYFLNNLPKEKFTLADWAEFGAKTPCLTINSSKMPSIKSSGID